MRPLTGWDNMTEERNLLDSLSLRIPFYKCDLLYPCELTYPKPQTDIWSPVTTEAMASDFGCFISLSYKARMELARVNM